MQTTPLTRPAATPQQHSRDYLVRVTAAALREIVFEHYCTLQDSTVLEGEPAGADRRAGLTEWVGRAGTVRVSLGWDWQELDDGQALPLLEVAPRRNLMVIDTKGYDLPPQAVASHLWEAVRQIHWQPFVRQEQESAFACLSGRPALLM